jgi:hypothetical protein
MPSIALNFINNSNDTNPNGIVIFQQNVAASKDLVSSVPVAWRVIKDSKSGDQYPFAVSTDLTVAASDSYGNVTPQQPAADRNRFDVISTLAGDQLRLNTNPASGLQIEVHNELPAGSINAMVYRNELLLAQKTGIAPGQDAAFVFAPTIYITLAPQIEQGDLIDAPSLSDVNFQFSVLGISSADIVMTGGGTGASAKPFVFTLQNVKMV